ncbi:hypothetical protein AXF42_Ash012388 [Apostasia shenzhenica]|uniref:Uncharacterized protein n=1 Tax=Apostasia shenzhenica TaxID=1088818 RepID=A0A2I0AD61_9ASPA|nr:hypothetical protein AXF42_Ash012388 [Apostasia shenzhenica]
MDRRGDLPPGADHLSINLPLDYCLSTAFDPQRDPPRTCSSGIGGAPERKLTLFALRLAILEKAASGVGALGFIWATVVLLGGFAIALERTDFWLVTVILLVEGARIFSRSHELEWQHQATWSIADTGALSFRAARCLRLLISSLRLLISSPRSDLSGDFSVAGKIQNTLGGSH